MWLPISLSVLCPGHMGAPPLSLHLHPLLSWPQEQLMALVRHLPPVHGWCLSSMEATQWALRDPVLPVSALEWELCK